MSRTRRTDNLIPLDPKIDRTARKARARVRGQRTEDPLNQQQQTSQNTMAEEQPQRSLRDYSNPTAGNIGTSVTRPPIIALHFEIKMSFISFIKEDQFYRHPGEERNDYLAFFLEKCDTLKMNGVTEDALR